jgi:membrane-associated protein
LTPTSVAGARNIAGFDRFDTGSLRRMLGLLAVSLSFLDKATDYVSGSPVTYAVITAVSAVDAFFPLVPSETTVIAAGTLAASGDLFLWAIIPAAAVGAFAGDNLTYALGATVGERAAGKIEGSKGRRRLEWAHRMLDEHGGLIIVGARFIPGGRTATMLAAGTFDMTWRRFAVYDAIAVTLWASYSALLGYIGGSAFREETWKALALGFGIALAVGVVIELARRIQARRRSDLPA